MTWQPQQHGLEEVLAMIRKTTSEDTAEQYTVTQRLNELRFDPDFLAYLAYIFLFSTTEQESHRAVAGLCVKNTILQRDAAANEPSAPAMRFVRSTILLGLSDGDLQIRQTAGTVVSSILGRAEKGSWPEALDALVKGMASQDDKVVESSFNTLQKVCEDDPSKLDIDIQGNNLIAHLVPEFIKYTGHNMVRIRISNLTILQTLAADNKIAALHAHIDSYISCLFARAADNSPDVRKLVCAALGLLLSNRPDKLVPHIKDVVQYMAYCSQEKDESVALEASEFWLTFAEEPALKEQLRPFITTIAPILLNGMVYSEIDLADLDRSDEEDEAVPDKESDIKPKTYGGKKHGAHETNDPSQSNANGGGRAREAGDKAFEEEEEEEYNDVDDDDDYDDDEGGGVWNIRKCSAAALDVMAVSFTTELLDALLPALKEKLFDGDWKNRECGILALGAIAEGCIDGLEPHLPEIVPWLINSLKDGKALVRSISCWTLGRYASWCVVTSAQDKSKFLVPTMEGLLHMVLDPNKKVQEAGCSAFATLEEEAGQELIPYLQPILLNLTAAFNKYQQKNLLILYDALGTLADSVGPALGAPAFLSILMPPLIERWERIQSDDDNDLVPLLECLSSISIAAGLEFAPYCQPVFQRCLNIVKTCLEQYQLYYQDETNELDPPDRTFIVVALDLLSGLTQGMGEKVAELVAICQPPLLQLMAMCLTHAEPPVRQSAHALLGDLAISCFSLLKPVIPQIMPAVIEQISEKPESECVSVCNNAAWAVGEISLQYHPDGGPLEPFVPALIHRLVPILLNTGSPKSLSENAAVTIGRLGLVCPMQVAPMLGTFAQAWCTALWEIKDNEEKDSAFRGFCMLISKNPSGLEGSFLWFCNAVCKWQHPSNQLDSMFRTILRGLKESFGNNWEAQAASFPPIIRQRLAERYQI